MSNQMGRVYLCAFQLRAHGLASLPGGALRVHEASGGKGGGQGRGAERSAERSAERGRQRVRVTAAIEVGGGGGLE